MESNTKITRSSLDIVLCRFWVVLTVIVLVINATDGIRVYEGTNFPGPTLKKNFGLSKKSLYISKRSWGPDDDLKPSVKAERRSQGKWKELSKRLIMEDGGPVLYKIKFTDKNYMQYIKYLKEVPRLEEYTFCLWYKPANLTHDQTLFLYSLNKKEILLRFWINALDSTLRMAIRENTVSRIPANLREHKWHHICQSWNGITGEMQVFLDGKMIGAGVLPHYEGTYIPEGGEVTLGQDLLGSGKELYDGMDGEMFGFNLVDESVPHDQGSFINSQYRPSVQASVPPFKKLPPMKKTYQEIKAFISALPGDHTGIRNKNEAFPGDAPNVIKKPKRNRGTSRVRHPPLRKVVVYNRDDRQLPLDEGVIELNKTNPEKPKQAEAPKNQKLNQLYDENYSVHSYRFGKQDKKSTNYEIYESIEDDAARPTTDEKLTDEELFKRKARQNFNLFTARQANKIYTLSSSVKDFRKPKFHFETSEPETGGRRSFVGGSRKPVAKAAERRASDAIPVYEIAEARRRRSADEESRQFAPDAPVVDANHFRRLPKIPESFINLFTQNASKSEIEEKLDQFFPKDESKEDVNVVVEITDAPMTNPDEVVSPETATDRQIPETGGKLSTELPEVVPAFSPIPFAGKISQVKRIDALSPANYLAGPEQFRDFDPRRPFGGKDSDLNAKFGEVRDQPANRRKFDISSGTDLVMMSYGACTSDRGSPVRDKERLVISWADTPVRIFGGAMIEPARNECGNF